MPRWHAADRCISFRALTRGCCLCFVLLFGMCVCVCARFVPVICRRWTLTTRRARWPGGCPTSSPCRRLVRPIYSLRHLFRDRIRHCDTFSVTELRRLFCLLPFSRFVFDIPFWFDLSSGCGRPVFLGWLDSFRLRAAEVDGYGCEKYAILSPQRLLRLSRACLGK